ncbi:tetratricopeptide repeat protein 5-like isoform X1 [Clavelina lepadiformis]|uniref:tetratricopeptide repeat protein 5-like isoform X1 n=2 Tax=Clavelina lepadiformis TaxID=159417 RepID=UPI0040433585
MHQFKFISNKGLVPVDMESSEDVADLVEKLYQYRDNFVDTHGLNNIKEKPGLVKCEMDKTLCRLKEQESNCQKTMYMLLYAKVLNIVPEYSRECEEYLSKVVKRDPSLIEAWNMLGETFWKKGDISAAKDCFEGALKRSKEKVSLRSLSMVLRQLKPSKLGDEQKNILQSVEHAKEAVQLDVNDGTSWYVLGNAYLSLFFSTEQNPKVLALSLNAYAQAEKVDPLSVHNPDLHFNRAAACRYEEAYKLALEGWLKAEELDPTWVEPRAKISELCNFLDKLNELVKKRGRLKNKRLQNLISSIKEKDLGPYHGEFVNKDKKVTLTSTNIKDLKEGRNEEKVLLGRVVCNLADLTLVPFTFAIVDSSGSCCAVTLYNLAQGRGMIIGDSVAIPEPYLTHHDIEWQGGSRWKFSSIRVTNPVVLVVNGKKLTNEHCGYTRVSMTPSDL